MTLANVGLLNHQQHNSNSSKYNNIQNHPHATNINHHSNELNSYFKYQDSDNYAAYGDSDVASEQDDILDAMAKW